MMTPRSSGPAALTLGTPALGSGSVAASPQTPRSDKAIKADKKHNLNSDKLVIQEIGNTTNLSRIFSNCVLQLFLTSQMTFVRWSAPAQYLLFFKFKKFLTFSEILSVRKFSLFEQTA